MESNLEKIKNWDGNKLSRKELNDFASRQNRNGMWFSNYRQKGDQVQGKDRFGEWVNLCHIALAR